MNTKKRPREPEETRPVPKQVGLTCKYHECHAVFSDSYGHNKHLVQVHGHEPHKCIVSGCTKSFYTKTALNVHMRTHMENRPMYPCDQCNRKYISRSGLNKHRRNIHRVIMQIPCTVEDCKATLLSKAAFTTHMRRSHAHLFVFKCIVDGCDQSFLSEAELQTHIAIHVVLPCTKCSFTTNSTLKLQVHRTEEHIMAQDIAKPNTVCSECGRSFSSRPIMVTHYNNEHRESFLSKCTLCSFSTMKPYKMCIHMREKHGPKRFICPNPECDYRTYHGSNLDRHIPIHSAMHIARRVKHENIIRDFLNNNHINFRSQHRVSFAFLPDISNKYAIVDFVIPHPYLPHVYFLLEVDEHQHSRYGVLNELIRWHGSLKRSLCNSMTLHRTNLLPNLSLFATILIVALLWVRNVLFLKRNDWPLCYTG